MFSLCSYSYSELRYNRTYIYPNWAISVGWMLACSSVIMIPIVAAYQLLIAPGQTLSQVSTVKGIVKIHHALVKVLAIPMLSYMYVSVES